MTINNGNSVTHSDPVLHNEHVAPASPAPPPEPPHDDESANGNGRKGEDS